MSEDLQAELEVLTRKKAYLANLGPENVYLEFSFKALVKGYFAVLAITFVAFAIFEEGFHSRETRMGKAIRAQLGAQDLHTFLALETKEMPYDKEVPECDYKTMTPKRFYNDYVKKMRPCLFKGYGKHQKAYNLWQNETYMEEMAGDEIIYAER